MSRNRRNKGILIRLQNNQVPAFIETIIFDIGDTLIDLKALVKAGLQAAYQELLHRGLLPKDSRLLESYWRVNKELSEPHLGRVFSDVRIVERSWEKAGLRPSLKAYVVFLTSYRSAVRKALSPNRQLINMLRKLKDMNVRLGIISDGDVDDLEVLVHLQIIDYFDYISISETFGREKIDDAIFLDTLAQLQAKPETSLMIGDNIERDIRWAKKVGMKTALVLSKGKILESRRAKMITQPDLVLEDVCDLLSYVLAPDAKNRKENNA